MLSSVWPPSTYQVKFCRRESGLVSHRPPRCTCSRPAMNSAGSEISFSRGSGRPEKPNFSKCYAHTAMATDAFVFWKSPRSPSLM